MTTLNEHDYLQSFIRLEELPQHYVDIAQQWFIPVINTLASKIQANKSVSVIGINGCQGSGKSTLSKLMVDSLKQLHQINAIAVSIDDFYYTRAERKQLAETIHPLLLTRGVPGSHDLDFALSILESLKQKTSCLIPTFNKGTDDRHPQSEWITLDKPVDVVIFEGWCMGSSHETDPQKLSTAVNTLEAEEDPSAAWREYINTQLATHYPRLFEQIDYWLMLKAPSFECVYQWRLEQENKLRRKLDATPDADVSGVMDEAAILRFIQHYQRITEHTLQHLPNKVNFLFELDNSRNIQSLTSPIAL